MIRLDHNEINRIRDEKRNLEVEVGKALHDFFNKHYKYYIRKVVRRLIEHILEADPAELDDWMVGQLGKFLIFEKRVLQPSWNSLRDFLGVMDFWTLGDCSDIIRLFGEANESWKKLGLDSKHKAGQLNLRPFPTYLKVGDGKKGWPKSFGHRHRAEIPEGDRVHRGLPYVDIKTILRGVDRYKFGSQSVINAIDRTFGLKPEGADVSGTTTDSIYALKWGGGLTGVSNDVLAAIQLLPFATMVPQGHHTMVECAYPLSRWGYIDYHIGYYDTLTPINVTEGDASLFRAALALFDRPDINRHVLVWGRGNGERGVQMEGDEVEEFKPMAKVLNAYGFCVTGGLQTFDEVLNVMKSLCPSLVRGREQAMRQGVGLSELERAFQKFGRR